jgi:predicted AlkP superfamily phosphohydrolase/phosphomutase
MSTSMLVVGLDAVEAPLLERLCDEGRLPTLGALRARALTARMRPACMDLLPGAIWQDLGTGRSTGRHGDFYPSRLHTGERMVRPIDATQHAADYYWARAAMAGRRVAVVDQPLVPVISSIPDVTLVAEWHVHDQLWGRGSHPPELLADLEARHGHRPLDRCDSAFHPSLGGYEAWLDRLLAELRVKTEMAVDLLGQASWDLFTIGFSDGHCAGHQLWHLHDPASALHPTQAPDRLRGSLEEVYVALDAALGELVAASGPDATTVLFTSHGMDRYIGGPQLLPTILTRLGLGDPRRVPPRLRPLVPVSAFQRIARRHARLGARAVAAVGARGFLRPGIRALALPNNRVGAIRLNVVGREPAGTVAPDEIEAEVAALSEELLALRQPGSGEPIVARVVRAADAYGPDHHPDLPDLLVQFRRDIGELTASVGPLSGHVEVDVRRPDYRRSGDHTDASRVWIAPASGGAPHDVGEVDTLDLAPTLLALLDVPVPPTMDGRPIAAAVGAASSR